MREFEGIVAFRDNDLLQNHLKGYPDLAKGGRALFLEGPLHLDNKLVHRPRSSAVLEGLNCVDEPQSRMLVSGLLDGWLMSLMSQPSAVPAATTSGSSLMR